MENLETGHKALFRLDVTVQPYTIPPIGPEDDGALRAELSEECANCAPLAAGASISRVDGTLLDEPCQDCRLTYPGSWAETRAGDEVQGEDGAWYPVKASDQRTYTQAQLPTQVVTLIIGGQEHAYDMPGLGPVRIKLGEEHRAIRNLKAGFPGTEEVR